MQAVPRLCKSATSSPSARAHAGRMHAARHYCRAIHFVSFVVPAIDRPPPTRCRLHPPGRCPKMLRWRSWKPLQGLGLLSTPHATSHTVAKRAHLSSVAASAVETDFSVAVCGAGAVGLSIGKYLSERGLSVCLIEAHDGPGQETSSRNSEGAWGH